MIAGICDLMEEIKKKNTTLEQTVKQEKANIQQLGDKLKEFNNLNKKLIISIKLLEEENQILEKELNNMELETKYFYFFKY